MKICVCGLDFFKGVIIEFSVYKMNMMWHHFIFFSSTVFLAQDRSAPNYVPKTYQKKFLIDIEAFFISKGPYPA